jgi:hypothetical protein
MVIPIPYGMSYSSTMSGAVLKLVRCEHCRAEYVYKMERVATGEGSSFLFLDNEGAASRASSEAQEVLRRKLEQGVDLVPCPACGWYQKNMLPKARRKYGNWMLNTGACLALSVIPVACLGGLFNGSRQERPWIPWSLFFAGLIALGVLGVVLMTAKFILAGRYDPNNQDVETRKQLGRARGMLREEFDRLLQAQQRNKAIPGEKAPPGTPSDGDKP